MFATVYLPDPAQMIAAFAISVLAVVILFMVEDEIIPNQKPKLLRSFMYFFVPLMALLIMFAGVWR